MESLHSYDIYKVNLSYQGGIVHNAGGSTAVNTLSVYGTPLSQPTALPESGRFEWFLPAELQRKLQIGRSLCTVTRVWSDIFYDAVVDWNHEEICLYSNLAQPYSFDTRTFGPSPLVWKGTATSHSGNKWSIDHIQDGPLINVDTFQTVAPIPNSLVFQFNSSQDPVLSNVRGPHFTDTVGPTTYGVSVQIGLTFLVPRVAIGATGSDVMQ